jgi:hypothetical protein
VSSSLPYIVRSLGLFGPFGVRIGVIMTHPIREKSWRLLSLRLPCLPLRTIPYPLRIADGDVSPPCRSSRGVTWATREAVATVVITIVIGIVTALALVPQNRAFLGFNPSQYPPLPLLGVRTHLARRCLEGRRLVPKSVLRIRSISRDIASESLVLFV